MHEIKIIKDGKELKMAQCGIDNLEDAVYNHGKCLTCKWRGSIMGTSDNPRLQLCYCRHSNISVDINTQECSNYSEMSPEEFGDFICHQEIFAYKKILNINVHTRETPGFVGYSGTQPIEKIVIHADRDTSKLIQSKLERVKEDVDEYNNKKLYSPLYACMRLVKGTASYLQENFIYLYDKLLGN